MVNIFKYVNNTLRPFVFLVAIFCIVPFAFAMQAYTERSADLVYQQRILYYVNAYRMKHHLSPLKMKQTITEEAQKHSHDMALHRMPFGHDGFKQRIKRLYQVYPNSRGGAENIAYYKHDAKALVDAWIASRGHRQNILGHYNLTGIGIAHNKKRWGYYTQIFVRNDSYG